MQGVVSKDIILQPDNLIEPELVTLSQQNLCLSITEAKQISPSKFLLHRAIGIGDIHDMQHKRYKFAIKHVDDLLFVHLKIRAMSCSRFRYRICSANQIWSGACGYI